MTDTPSAEEIKEWREIEQKATEGPWVTQESCGQDGAYHKTLIGNPDLKEVIAEFDSAKHKRESSRVDEVQPPLDAAFVAHARTAMPRLIDFVERVRGAVGRYESHLSHAVRCEQSPENAARLEAKLEEIQDLRKELGLGGDDE